MGGDAGIGTSWKKPQGFKQDRQHRVDGTLVQRYDDDDGGGGSQPFALGQIFALFVQSSYVDFRAKYHV